MIIMKNAISKTDNKQENDIKLEDERESLRNEVLKLAEKVNTDKDYVNKINKRLELFNTTFIYDCDHYKNLVFNDIGDNTINNLDIEIEFVETNVQKDLWKFFKINTSSIRTRNGPGRNISMLVKDRKTDKYLGLLKISSDSISIKSREDYIGWTNREMQGKNNGVKKLNYLVNVRCCVGLQPIAYNLNVGKLLISLCFSKEVQEYYKKKYGHYIAGITTFSIYGKSIQYDRIKNIKLIGYTNGDVPDLPDVLYEKLLAYMKKIDVDMSIYNSFTSSKIRKIQQMLRVLDLNVNILNHKIERGIYFGYTGTDSKDFLCGKKDSFTPELKTTREITDWWKNRWAIQRYNNLKKSHSLQYHIDLLYLRKRMINNQRVNLYYDKLREKIGETAFKELKNKYARQYYEQKKHEGHIIHIESGLCKIDFNNQYLGGLYDGDGTITIHKGKTGYQLKVIFSQSVTNILELLQKKYGGKIYKSSRVKENHRREYIHILRGQDCEYILKDLKKGCILKYEQVLIAKQFIKLINKSNGDLSKFELFDKIRALNAREIHSVYKPYNNVNIQYISGLFDAEGHIGTNRLNNLKVKITQKNDTNILYIIEEKLGFGSVDNTCWYNCNSKLIYNFLIDIIPYLIVKKLQVELGLKFIDTIINKKNYDCNIIELRKELDISMKKDKHTSIEIDYDIIKDENKKQEKLKLNIQNDIKEINKLKNKDVARAKMSVAKLGIGNPNYGIDRCEEHSKNISKSMLLKNRKISDEDIDMIIDLHKSGETHKDIGSIFDISRQYVDDIVNGKIKKMSYIKENIAEIVEENRQKKIKTDDKYKNMTNDEIKIEKNRSTSKSKRYLTVEQMIQILKYKGKVPSTHIKDYIDLGEDISPNIIKNVWSGKTKIFKEEFDNIDMTYEEYLNILSIENKISSTHRSKSLSIANRTLTFDQIIEVLFMMEKKIPYKNILENLLKKYGENGGNDGKKITINVIKKIKTIKIFEEEFYGQIMTFQKYQEILAS
jgi:hypothetical protein